MKKLEVSKPLRAAQWGIISQLAVIGMINYMDRATIAIANPLMRQDMGITLPQMGLLLSVFPMTYALSQLPLGILIDRLGPRKLLGMGVALWSLAQALSGLATGVNQLWVFRFLLGIGEGPSMPAGTKVIKRWFAADQRGGAMGIFTGANHFGQAIAAPVLTGLMVLFGWRWMFILMGLIGFVSAAIWLLTYKEPKDAQLSAADRAALVRGDSAPPTGEPMTFSAWKRLFRFRTSWGLFIGVFGASYMAGIYATWLPAYLEMTYHLSVGKTGLAVAIPFTCATIGSVFAGWLADAITRRNHSAFDAGRIVFIIGLIGLAGFTVLTARSGDVVMATTWISCAMFFSQLSGTCSWLVAANAVPESSVASFGGIQNCFGYIGGALAPAITGFAVAESGSFTVPLFIGAGISVVSAVIYWFVANGPIESRKLTNLNTLSASVSNG
ncbi:MFS transporter (plasmid) [Neorhizobium sp. NCHU2750]|nr:MFS transporter [Neorhizobium sp. NCHU2750]